MSVIATRSEYPARLIALAMIGIVCLGLFVALLPVVAGVASPSCCCFTIPDGSAPRGTRCGH